MEEDGMKRDWGYSSLALHAQNAAFKPYYYMRNQTWRVELKTTRIKQDILAKNHMIIASFLR